MFKEHHRVNITVLESLGTMWLCVLCVVCVTCVYCVCVARS